MKRLFILVLALSFIICFFPRSAQATESNTTIQYFDDGSYLVTELEITSNRMITKVASKNSTYYSSFDVPQWKITVTGEFLYDGSTSTCTYASGTYTIYVTSGWAFVSDSASCRDNTGTYTIVFSRLSSGITVGPASYALTITCDENGNIS